MKTRLFSQLISCENKVTIDILPSATLLQICNPIAREHAHLMYFIHATGITMARSGMKDILGSHVWKRWVNYNHHRSDGEVRGEGGTAPRIGFEP